MPTAPLSNYLKMHRKRSGLSQPELAFLLGGSHGSKISRYERGERRPSLDALIAFEVLFHGSTEVLFTGRYDRIVHALRRRATSLHRRLAEETAPTPHLRRKITFLVEVAKASSLRRS